MLLDKKIIIKWKKENNISDQDFWKIIKTLIKTHENIIKKLLNEF